MTKFKCKLLSIGNNQKLGKNIGIFNLPQGITCPGKTALCQKICYACKAERCYKSARNMRLRNLMYINDYGTEKFTEDMIEEIKKSRVTMVRIHESGDFFFQGYLDAWVNIVKACSEVKFLSYTKSFMLNWQEAAKQPNWSILWSIDNTTTLPVPFLGPTCYLRTPTDPIPLKGVTCQHTSSKHYCGTECHICWNAHCHPAIKVYLDQH